MRIHLLVWDFILIQETCWCETSYCLSWEFKQEWAECETSVVISFLVVWEFYWVHIAEFNWWVNSLGMRINGMSAVRCEHSLGVRIIYMQWEFTEYKCQNSRESGSHSDREFSRKKEIWCKKGNFWTSFA